MKANVDQPMAPESKSGTKPKSPESKWGSKRDSKDDLKSLPMPEGEKRLGSSAKGLSQAEAQKRLAQYGPELFLGSHSVDDQRGSDSVGDG
jgi:H+-transporting ATPase